MRDIDNDYTHNSYFINHLLAEMNLIFIKLPTLFSYSTIVYTLNIISFVTIRRIWMTKLKYHDVIKLQFFYYFKLYWPCVDPKGHKVLYWWFYNYYIQHLPFLVHEVLILTVYPSRDMCGQNCWGIIIMDGLLFTHFN